MDKAERSYVVCKREAFIIVFSLTMFPVYLLSDLLFTIITDHKVLQHPFEKPDIHCQIARWLDLLAEYDFAMKHRPAC